MTSKQCFKCLNEKPLCDFYGHPKMADGHLNKCKECTKKDVTLHRQENLEHFQEYERKRSSLPHRVELHAKVYAAYAIKYPNRVKANMAARNAVRDGRLTKLPCLMCGSDAVAHHPDYDRPLDVVWLCHSHHKKTHAMHL